MRIAVVSGFVPYPANFGGALDVWERIKGLTALGHEVDLIATDKNNPTKEQIEEIELYAKNFYFTRRKNEIKQLFAKLPLQFLSRKDLASIKINQSYDLVILESEFCWPITLNTSITYNKIVVRVHNIESHYFKMLGNSSSSLKEKVYYKIEVAKIKQFTPSVFNKVDRLWFISKDDLQAMNYTSKSVFMPYPINDEFVIPTEKKDTNVVFMGSLFMQNNLYGLQWYLKHVHPILVKDLPNYHFYIIGSLKDQNNTITSSLSNIKQATLIVNTPNLETYYNKAQVFVNPMFHGSGVKVKSVNALVNGLPLVSTKTGAEGIGLDESMYYHAETAQDFIREIKNIFNDRSKALEKTKNAQTYLEGIHYLEVLKNELHALK